MLPDFVISPRCDHSLGLPSFSVPSLHCRQEAERAQEERWFAGHLCRAVVRKLVPLLPRGPGTEDTFHAWLLQRELFGTLCQLVSLISQ